MGTRRSVLVGALVLAGAGALGGLYLRDRGDDRGPTAPATDYTPGNVIVENWADVDHTVTLTARSNREPVETVTDTPADTSSDELAFETKLAVEGPGTRLVPAALAEPDVYRVTVRAEAGGRAEHNAIRLWRTPEGALAGDAVRVRIYDGGSLNVVGFSGGTPPTQNRPGE